MATQASLRSHMGFVPQDTVLFNDTILHNIRWAPASMPYPAYSSRTRCSHIHPRSEVHAGLLQPKGLSRPSAPREARGCLDGT